jgi:hypothetical protein
MVTPLGLPGDVVRPHRRQRYRCGRGRFQQVFDHQQAVARGQRGAQRLVGGALARNKQIRHLALGHDVEQTRRRPVHMQRQIGVGRLHHRQRGERLMVSLLTQYGDQFARMAVGGAGGRPHGLGQARGVSCQRRVAVLAPGGAFDDGDLFLSLGGAIENRLMQGGGGCGANFLVLH